MFYIQLRQVLGSRIWRRVTCRGLQRYKEVSLPVIVSRHENANKPRHANKLRAILQPILRISISYFTIRLLDCL